MLGSDADNPMETPAAQPDAANGDDDGDGDDDGQGDGDGDGDGGGQGDGDGDAQSGGDGDGDMGDPTCSSDAECDRDDERMCDAVQGRCVECLTAADCTDPDEIDCVDGECIECLIDTDCAGQLSCMEGFCEF